MAARLRRTGLGAVGLLAPAERVVERRPYPGQQWRHGWIPVRPTPEELRLLSEDDLVDMFSRVSRAPKLDEDLLRDIDAELARREESAVQLDRALRSGEDRAELDGPFEDLSADAGDDAVQRRVDELVAKGVPYRAAYADAHGVDERALTRADLAAMVDAQRRPGETRKGVVKRLYAEITALSMLRAEAWTRGNLLNRAAQSENARRQARGNAPIHPQDLFSGPRASARKWAADELKRYWDEIEPRVTFTEFRAMMLGRAADVQAAERIRLAGQDKEFGL